MSSRISLGLAVVVAVFGTWAGTASAATSIVASPVNLTFEPGPYVQGLGEIAIFDNSQSETYHDVTTDQKGPDGERLFGSEMIPGGTTTPVEGTQYLPAGTYAFYCALHGAGMSGNLVIDASQGKVVPRPSVRVSFVKQKLKQIRKSGRVRVKVKAVSASKPVTITLNKGKVALGVKRNLGFKAGQARTMAIPLTKRGRKVIRKGKVVQFKLRATVPFGKPSAATRKVR